MVHKCIIGQPTTACSMIYVLRIAIHNRFMRYHYMPYVLCLCGPLQPVVSQTGTLTISNITAIYFNLSLVCTVANRAGSQSKTATIVHLQGAWSSWSPTCADSVGACAVVQTRQCVPAGAQCDGSSAAVIDCCAPTFPTVIATTTSAGTPTTLPATTTQPTTMSAPTTQPTTLSTTTTRPGIGTTSEQTTSEPRTSASKVFSTTAARPTAATQTGQTPSSTRSPSVPTSVSKINKSFPTKQFRKLFLKRVSVHTMVYRLSAEYRCYASCCAQLQLLVVLHKAVAQ